MHSHKYVNLQYVNMILKCSLHKGMNCTKICYPYNITIEDTTYFWVRRITWVGWSATLPTHVPQVQYKSFVLINETVTSAAIRICTVLVRVGFVVLVSSRQS